MEEAAGSPHSPKFQIREVTGKLTVSSLNVFFYSLYYFLYTNMAEKDLVSRPERRNLVSRPGEKFTFEPTNNKLHSSFALLTTDAKKHNGV